MSTNPIRRPETIDLRVEPTRNSAFAYPQGESLENKKHSTMPPNDSSLWRHGLNPLTLWVHRCRALRPAWVALGLGPLARGTHYYALPFTRFSWYLKIVVIRVTAMMYNGISTIPEMMEAVVESFRELIESALIDVRKTT